MYDNLIVEEGVDLPHFPDGIDPTEVTWQTKSLSCVFRTYRLTADGRLLRKEESCREKTADEKQAEAEKWGYDSWDEYVAAYDNMDDDISSFYPESIDYDLDEDGYEDSPPTLYPQKQVLEEEFYVDHNAHGSIEFHTVLRREPTAYDKMELPSGKVIETPTEHKLDVFLSYEARFTKGELDEIVLLGDRGGDSLEEVKEKIQEWNEGR